MTKTRILLILMVALPYPVWNVGSAYTLAHVGSHPVTALVRGRERLPLAAPGVPAAAGEVQGIGGKGTWLGYSFDFQRPDGGTITCRAFLQGMRCGDGWTAERAGN